MAALLTTLRTATAAFVPTSVVGATHWWDFSDLTHIFTDTAATTPVSADGNNIKAVTDKIGSIKLSEATNPPVYKTGANGINSVGVGLWNASNSSLGSATFSQAQPFSLVVVYKHATGTLGGATERLVIEAAPSAIFALATAASIGSGTNSRLFEYAGTVSAVPDATALDANTHIVVGIYNGASSQLWLDGVQQTLTPASPGAGALATASAIFVGSYNGTQVLNGRIAQVMVVNGAISTPDRDHLEALWGSTYGITVA